LFFLVPCSIEETKERTFPPAVQLAGPGAMTNMCCSAGINERAPESSASVNDFMAGGDPEKNIIEHYIPVLESGVTRYFFAAFDEW